MFAAILHNAPAWVWVLLALLIALGVWLSFPRRMTLRRATFTPMLLLMGVFFTKFAVAAMLAVQPALKPDPVFAAWVGLAYGSFSGLFLGRTTVMWKVARRAGRATA